MFCSVEIDNLTWTYLPSSTRGYLDIWVRIITAPFSDTHFIIPATSTNGYKVPELKSIPTWRRIGRRNPIKLKFSKDRVHESFITCSKFVSNKNLSSSVICGSKILERNRFFILLNIPLSETDVDD